MSELSFQKKAELWGKAYEILVKRGVLACLSEKGLLDQSLANISPWREMKLTKVSGDLLRELDILDERERDLAKRAFDHLALCSFGLPHRQPPLCREGIEHRWYMSDLGSGDRGHC